MVFLIKSLVLVLVIAKSLGSTSDEGVKYANRCEGLLFIIENIGGL